MKMREKKASNLWRALATDELDRILMRCAEIPRARYCLLSDYEKFSTLCAGRHLFVGTLEEGKLRKKWAHLLGATVPLPSLAISENGRIAFWRQACEMLGCTASESWEERSVPCPFCDEKENLNLKALFEKTCDENCQNKSDFMDLNFCLSHIGDRAGTTWKEWMNSLFPSDNITFFADVMDRDFVRPNPYAAELAWNAALSGEKNKEENLSLLFYYMILSVLEQNKRGNLQCKICVYLSDVDDSATKFLDYLVLRGLGRGLVLAVGTGEDASRLSEHPICAAEPSAVSVAFWQADSVGSDEAEKNASAVAAHLPIGVLLSNALWLDRVAENDRSALCLSAVRALWERLLADREP